MTIEANHTEKIEAVLEHIKHVQENCYKLGLKLIKGGEVEMGRNLIANGQIHDNSKFRGIEFEHLFEGSAILTDVVKHHSMTNAHHPEYWGGIQNMPDLYLAEMVCDCTARSAEFGDNIWDWMMTKATSKYEFVWDSEVGRKIYKYLSMLLVPRFKAQS